MCRDLVTSGFLAGIAVHILLSQLPSVLGVPAPEGGVMLQRLVALAGEVGRTNPYTLAIGVGDLPGKKRADLDIGLVLKRLLEKGRVVVKRRAPAHFRQRR